MKDTEQEKIGKALMKVALGFQVAEVTEEFAEVDGELKLTKRKRTKKDVPPDLKAVQLLLAENGGVSEYADMSDEELEMEKMRLLAALKVSGEKAEDGGQVLDESQSTPAKAKRKTRAKPRKRVVRKK
ncbi:MAG: hypothetical protein J6U60_03110 [Clostridia bacterium]|nr:hypothetical protein [Clostridia bacterium]